MRPTVVIVNYNGAATLCHCLAALQSQSERPNIIVVDNASQDDSLESAVRAFPNAAFVPLRHNAGFARAFNIGVQRIADPTGIVIALNPDTHPRPDFIEQITAPLRSEPDLGSVAGTLTFTTAPDTIASAGIAVHRNGVAIDAQLGETLSDRMTSTVPVFGPSGGAAAYRLSVFRAVGGFCEPFFLYLEDVDLAWRMRLAGYGSVWNPLAVALHDYSASAGEGSPFKRRLIARNRIWTLARCLPYETWKRDWRAILTLDAAALAYGTVTFDPAAIGRLEAIATLPIRLREGAHLRKHAVVTADEIDRWLLPSLSARELRRLRQMTGRLAKKSTL
ncbi:MAG: glycosyltransferase family 2 protein [Thermomicrobiales bacterium]|nr:glycosyltransferase family 2 protein [Thermomicrobiales bacterium]